MPVRRKQATSQGKQEEALPLPQDIRPALQDVQDTVVRAEEPWIEQSPTSKIKVLWVSRDSSRSRRA